VVLAPGRAHRGRRPTAPLVAGIVLRTLRSTALTALTASDCQALTTLGNSAP